MNMIFYRPVLAIVNKRQNYIDSNNSKAEELTTEARGVQNELEEKLRYARISAGQKLKADLEKLHKSSDQIIKKEKGISRDNIQSAKDSIKVTLQSIQDELNQGVIDDIADYIVQKAG